MSYTSVETPRTNKLLEECQSGANQINKAETEKIERYNRQLYNRLREEIIDFTTIKKKIAEEISYGSTRLSYLAPKIDRSRGRMPSGAYGIVPRSAMYEWVNDTFYNSEIAMKSTQDIFLTTKYGDKSLQDLLQEKLEQPFRIVIIPSTFWVRIEWGEVKKDKNNCVLV